MAPTNQPDRPEWTEANGIGMAGEQAVAAIFQKIGIAVAKTPDRCADLAIAGKIEVKHDRKAHTSGFVAVEVSYRGNPSGIHATCAGGWAFVLATGEVFLINTHRLRAAVAGLADVPGGERAMVRLLPVGELRRLAVCIGGTP